jgi:hypothetical protein
MIAAYLDTSHVYYGRPAAGCYCHEFSSWWKFNFSSPAVRGSFWPVAVTQKNPAVG